MFHLRDTEMVTGDQVKSRLFLVWRHRQDHVRKHPSKGFVIPQAMMHRLKMWLKTQFTNFFSGYQSVLSYSTDLNYITMLSAFSLRILKGTLEYSQSLTHLHILYRHIKAYNGSYSVDILYSIDVYDQQLHQKLQQT